jgi:hypothetical protein
LDFQRYSGDLQQGTLSGDEDRVTGNEYLIFLENFEELTGCDPGNRPLDPRHRREFREVKKNVTVIFGEDTGLLKNETLKKRMG